MAKVKITGHASGSGVLTITAPNTSTDRTITLPDATGTLLNTNGNAASLTAIPAAQVTGTLPAISGANLTNIAPQGRKNILINGDFRINQRGLTASAVAVTNGAFNIDRAKNYLVGVSGTVALGDAEAVNGTYETPLKYTAGSTASGRLGLYQTVEDYHFGETLTASAWVKSDNANARIVAYDGSTETSSNTHTGGGGWELLKVTFSQRTNAGQLYIWCSIISSSVGSVSIASGDYIFITKFQCERGSVATEFERLTNAEQLSLCQRYFERFAKVSSETVICLAQGASTTLVFGRLFFATEKRVVPSGSVSSAGHIQVLTGAASAWNAATGVALNAGNKKCMRLSISGLSGMTAGGCHEVRINDTNGYIDFDAEI